VRAGAPLWTGNPRLARRGDALAESNDFDELWINDCENVPVVRPEEFFEHRERKLLDLEGVEELTIQGNDLTLVRITPVKRGWLRRMGIRFLPIDRIQQQENEVVEVRREAGLHSTKKSGA
jgi:hypothetical protein